MPSCFHRPSFSSTLRSYLVMYACGSILYPILELLWRGYTHFTMVILGGVCGIMIHHINRRLYREPLLTRALFCCFTITITEFLVGCLVNLTLRWNVWDYSSHPFHIWGQVCLLYAGAWFLISIPALFISDLIRKHLTPYLTGPLFFREQTNAKKGDAS